MIIIMKPGAPPAEIERVNQKIVRLSIKPKKSIGQQRVIIGLLSDTSQIDI
ncbi:hypothetical protein [Nostoc commune]|uniref:hypothetical protein n=1 Tax=Nostoc commune TaxID=1178 RepID=UPI0018C67B8E|nr:hypothetical protein [Nostoc commune]